MRRAAACLLALLLAGCRHPEAPPAGDLAKREQIGPKRSIAPIGSVLAHSPNADVRVACLVALGASQDPAAAQAALPSLQDPAEMVRAAALDVVEARRPEGAADAVAAMYAWLPPSGAWHEKERLLADLVAWKDPRACGLLLDALAKELVLDLKAEAGRLGKILGAWQAEQRRREAEAHQRKRAVFQKDVLFDGVHSAHRDPADDEGTEAVADQNQRHGKRKGKSAEYAVDREGQVDDF